jgi:hypothetical protein
VEDSGSDSVGGQLVLWWAEEGVVAHGQCENQRKEEIGEGFQRGGVLDGGPRGGGECGSWPQPVDGVTAAQERRLWVAGWC